MRTMFASVMFAVFVSGVLVSRSQAGVMVPLAREVAKPAAGESAISPAGISPVRWEQSSSSSVATTGERMFLLGDLDLPTMPKADSSKKVNQLRPDTAGDIPVEPIPTPSALAAGLAALSGLAAVRFARRLRFV